ncbi:AAA family ATPase [Rhodococcus sp. NPDC019609]
MISDGLPHVGRHRLTPVQILTQSPASVTWQVRDSDGNDQVLKVVSATEVDEHWVSLWVENAQRSARSRIPGLPMIIDVGRDGNGGYILREYVPGRSLAEHSGPPRGRVPVAIAMARTLLTELAAAHAYGLAHLGIRPGNIIVPESAADVRLVDYGSGTGAIPLTSGRRAVAAARYLSPEQAGLINRPPSTASDVYSLGLVLFEYLAREPLISGNDLGMILRDHLSAVKPSLAKYNLDVSAGFEGVLTTMLSRDPDDRFESAAEALAALEQLMPTQADGTSSILRDHEVALVAVREPRLIGRTGQLAELEEKLAATRSGSPQAVLVVADTGGGKTRLLDEFAQRAQKADFRVLRGYGVDGALQHPLQQLTGIVDDLVSEVGRQPRYAQLLSDRLAPHTPQLMDLFPAWSNVVGHPPTSPLPPPFEPDAMAKSSAALTELLRAVDCDGRTTLILLDDAQWIDGMSARAVRNWCRTAVSAEGRVMLVATVRPRTTGPVQDLVESMNEYAAVITLPPLTADQVEQMIRTMAGELPAEIRDLVVNLSDGQPISVSETLRGLVESGHLQKSADHWVVGRHPDDMWAPAESSEMVHHRMALLSHETRGLLRAGAVLGREFESSLASRIVGCSDHHARQAIEQATERAFIRTVGPNRCAFVHDSLRDALQAGIPAEQRKQLHLKAAELIEQVESDRCFEIAFHFDQADHSGRAFAAALASGDIARARYDLELAERQYRIANRGVTEQDVSTRRELAEKLGRILVQRGHYREADTQLENALRLATDEITAVRIKGWLGESKFRGGDVAAGDRFLVEALEMLGERLPSAPRLPLAVIVELMRRIRHELIPSGTGVQPDLQEQMRSHLLTELQYPRWFDRARLNALWLMLRQVNTAEKAGLPAQLARAYGIWGAGLALTFPFLWKRGLRYVERSADISDRTGDLRAKAHAASMRGCVLQAGGRYRDALTSLDSAISLHENHGDLWEASYAAYVRATCLYRLGDLRGAMDESRRLRALGFGLESRYARVAALEIAAKCTSGRTPTESPISDDLTERNLEIVVASCQTDALRLRHADRLPEALERLDTAVKILGRTWPHSTYLAPAYAWRATISRELVEQSFLPEDRRQAMHRAEKAARRALRSARIYRNDLPHAQREMGIVAALKGRIRAARRWFDASDRAAVRVEAAAELVETAKQRERFGLGSSGQVSGVVTRDHIDPMTDTPTLGLVDRFSSLLDLGASMASARSLPEIQAAIHATAEKLLRAETCTVLGLGVRATPFDLEDVPEVGRQLAATALRTGRPVILRSPVAAREHCPDPLALYSARSAMCSPILVEERVVGVFFATHSTVGWLFGEEEERLAELVSRLAGAAVERLALQWQRHEDITVTQEAERKRVARDLHDEIGQLLTSALIDVRQIAATTAGTSDSAVGHTRRLETTLQAAITAAKRIAFELRPAVLDDLGLIPALAHLADRHNASDDLEVALEVVDMSDVPQLSPIVETSVYRMVQESLTNVRRHANATECTVLLARSASSIRVVIEDNGAGFTHGTSEGLGLRGMRERAELAGGTLQITSDDGVGTTVAFEIPIV